MKKWMYEKVTKFMIWSCSKTPVLPVLTTIVMLLLIYSTLSKVESGLSKTIDAKAYWDDNQGYVVMSNSDVLNESIPDKVLCFDKSEADGKIFDLNKNENGYVYYTNHKFEHNEPSHVQQKDVKIKFIYRKMTALERIIHEYK